MPAYEHDFDAVQWHLQGITHRLVAKSGNVEDRYHLGKIILQTLEDDGDKILQIDGYTGEEETKASVLKRTKQCAVALKKLGVVKDDVIVLMAPNHLDLTIPVYAGLAMGAPIAPVDRLLGVNELKDTFAILTPKIIFCQSEKIEDVKIAIDKIGVQTTIISFDGGDGALKFSDIIKENENEFVSKSTSVPPFERFLVVSPIHWLSGMFMFLNSAILKMSRVQSTLHITPEHAFELINKFKPNFLTFSPTMMTTLLKIGKTEKCDFSSVEYVMLGGSAVYPDLVAELKKYIPNATIVTGYGMSELTGIALEHKYSSPPESCGKPIRTLQYRLVDPESGKDVIDQPHVNGEFWFKGPGIITTYYKNPKATKEAFVEDGWLKSGDMLYRDENWNFYFVERIKLLLKYKNHQISPVELEAVIRQHPGVLDVAVTGIPDRECGDLPVACVVTRLGHTVTAQEIKDLVKANVTDSKQLRGGVLFLNELPLTASTKIHRRQLKEIVLNSQLE